MGFAVEYLQKQSGENPFLKTSPHPDTECIVCIPAYNESRLLQCLDSLFQCHATERHTEVILLINDSLATASEIRLTNQAAFDAAQDWISGHQKEKLDFFVHYLSGLPPKHFGAGLARKLLMDEAVSRFNTLGNPHGVILSLDADTQVDKTYLSSLMHHFAENPSIDGCSIYFEHPLEGIRYPEEVYKAVSNYELHQRYYLQAIRSTGFPYAYHTVGSCFGVRAGAYCKAGGMNKRPAGEDFYFIQKLAVLGKYSECNTTRVVPSPRASDRVPFGTGPAIAKQLSEKDSPFLSFHPELFSHLKEFYDAMNEFYTTDEPGTVLEKLHPCIQQMSRVKGFEVEIAEIKANVASLAGFRKRFFRKYNMFWILKYLHFAEEKGFPKIEITKAASTLIGANEKISRVELLKAYRKTDRSHSRIPA